MNSRTRQITKEFNLPNWPQIKQNYKFKKFIYRDKNGPYKSPFCSTLLFISCFAFSVHSKVFPALKLSQKSRRSNLWPKGTVAGWMGSSYHSAFSFWSKLKNVPSKNWRCQMSCRVSDTAAVTLPPAAVGQLEWCNYPVVAIATYSWSS